MIVLDTDRPVLSKAKFQARTGHIPYPVQSRLKDIGYVKEVLGGLVLTDDGFQRIAIDRECVRTFFKADVSR